MNSITLKKYQFLDAYRTAPANIGLFALISRLIGTLSESLYGKEVFDAVVIGDDPIVSMALAIRLASRGSRVLLAPDSLGTDDWPHKEWGYELARLTNEFDETVAAVLAENIIELDDHSGYMKALSALINKCASTPRISLLYSDSLQSSAGLIKGCNDLIFFPLHRDFHHVPMTNPLWRFARKSISQLHFNHAEIEFVQARSLFITTPTSRYIDPTLGIKVGLAREGEAGVLRCGRADDVRSAFIHHTGEQ
jgi:hypothetical protein